MANDSYERFKRRNEIIQSLMMATPTMREDEKTAFARPALVGMGIGGIGGGLLGWLAGRYADRSWDSKVAIRLNGGDETTTGRRMGAASGAIAGMTLGGLGGMAFGGAGSAKARRVEYINSRLREFGEPELTADERDKVTQDVDPLRRLGNSVRFTYQLN